MNQNEIIGYNHLLSLGYKPSEIKFNYKTSPDFITSDGKGWEVKNIDSLHFSEYQMFMPLDTNIILVDNNNKPTVFRFDFILQFVTQPICCLLRYEKSRMIKEKLQYKEFKEQIMIETMRKDLANANNLMVINKENKQ